MTTINSKLLNSVVYYIFILFIFSVLLVPFNILNIKMANIPFHYVYIGTFVSILLILSFIQNSTLTVFDKWLFFLMLGFSASLITSIDRIHTIRTLTGLFLKGIAIAFISERISKARIKSTSIILMYCAASIALIGLGEIILGRHLYHFEPYYWIPHIISSTVGNPLPFAAYLVLFFPLSLWYIEYKNNVVRVLPILIITLGIIFSFSRSGWIALFLAFIIYSMKKGFLKKIVKKWMYIVPYIIISIFMLLKMPASFQTQFDKFNRGMFSTRSFEHRSKSFITVKNILKDYPLFGVGFGNYPQVHEQYMVEGVVKEAPTPDNMYIRLFADTGIVGGFVFLSFIAFWLFQLWKNRNNVIIWAIFCGVIGFLINMMAADLFLWTIPQFAFWMLFGLGVNIINGISDKNR